MWSSSLVFVAGPVGTGKSLQASLLYPSYPDATFSGAGYLGWMLHPSVPLSQPARARSKCGGRRSESREKGTERFHLCAVPASVFVSGFLCGWGLVHTKIADFPPACLKSLSAQPEPKQTGCVCSAGSGAKGTFWVAGVRSSLLRSAAEFLPRTLPRAFIRENKQQA